MFIYTHRFIEPVTSHEYEGKEKEYLYDNHGEAEHHPAVWLSSPNEIDSNTKVDHRNDAEESVKNMERGHRIAHLMTVDKVLTRSREGH
jgi:hypothetical protein